MSGYFTETNVSVAFEVCFILKRKKRQKYKKGSNEKRKTIVAINKIWIN